MPSKPTAQKPRNKATRGKVTRVKKPVVGIIGIGAMGLPMAGHLLKAHFKVNVFDVSAKQMRAAAGTGAHACKSAEDLASASDAILVIVPSDQDVRDVCLGPGGVLAGARRGTVVAICSSILPDTAVTIAKAAKKSGVGVVDAPMTKGVQGAIEGNMTMLVGGTAADMAKLQRVLRPFSEAVHHVGPIGAGSVAKTANNMIIWAELLAVKETLELGAKYGVTPAKMRTALMDCSANSWVLQEFPRIVPTWPRKDLDIALKLADAVKLHMPLAGLSRGLLTHMSEADIKRAMKS